MFCLESALNFFNWFCNISIILAVVNLVNGEDFLIRKDLNSFRICTQPIPYFLHLSKRFSIKVDVNNCLGTRTYDFIPRSSWTAVLTVFGSTFNSFCRVSIDFTFQTLQEGIIPFFVVSSTARCSLNAFAWVLVRLDAPDGTNIHFNDLEILDWETPASRRSWTLCRFASCSDILVSNTISLYH